MNGLYGRWANGIRYESKKELYEGVNEGLYQLRDLYPYSDIVIYIGTDSNKNRPVIVYSSAIIVHSVGNGAQCYYINDIEPHTFSTDKKKTSKDKLAEVRHRLITESVRSVDIAWEMEDIFVEHEIEYTKPRILELLEEYENPGRVEIHADINRSKEFLSSRVIKEAIGIIEGQGFFANPKPDSFAATNIADELTRRFNWRRYVKKIKGKWEILK